MLEFEDDGPVEELWGGVTALEEDGTLTAVLEDDIPEEPCPLLVSGTLDRFEDISGLSVPPDVPISEDDTAELPETVLLC